ncbi:MAG: hypothetical protein II374_00215 [Lachnospiraceae bacterium]|nr:hypothetical protein [Lachnospiraceae bacterium]
MKKTSETMKAVAERCSRYSHDCCCSKNTTKDSEVTCQTCIHYNTENVCDLDLYSEIMKNHNI